MKKSKFEHKYLALSGEEGGISLSTFQVFSFFDN